MELSAIVIVVLTVAVMVLAAVVAKLSPSRRIGTAGDGRQGPRCPPMGSTGPRTRMQPADLRVNRYGELED